MPAYKTATWCHNIGNPNLKIQALYISLNSIWHIYPLTLTNHKITNTYAANNLIT